MNGIIIASDSFHLLLCDQAVETESLLWWEGPLVPLSVDAAFCQRTHLRYLELQGQVGVLNAGDSFVAHSFQGNETSEILDYNMDCVLDLYYTLVETICPVYLDQ